MPDPLSNVLTWAQLVSPIINIAVLLFVIKLVRQFSRVELKVDTMWTHFIKGTERRNRVRSDEE